MIGLADIALAAAAATLIYLCCFRPWPHEEARERQALLDELWADDSWVAADADPAVGLADVGGDNTPAWQPSLCVGRTSQAGAGPFDRERSLREV